MFFGGPKSKKVSVPEPETGLKLRTGPSSLCLLAPYGQGVGQRRQGEQGQFRRTPRGQVCSDTHGGSMEAGHTGYVGIYSREEGRR